MSTTPIFHGFRRIKHAAHTGKGTGWDLEQWDVISPTKTRTEEVPSNAEYHSGYLDNKKQQHWVFVRRAPLSPEPCNHGCDLQPADLVSASVRK